MPEAVLKSRYHTTDVTAAVEPLSLEEGGHFEFGSGGSENGCAPFVGKRPSTWVVRAFCDVNLWGRLFLPSEGGSRKSLLRLFNICAGQTENDVAPFSGFNPILCT